MGFQVDGGMTKNSLLLQMQANLLGCEIVCPKMTEVSCWGAAIAAAVGIGLLSVDRLLAKSTAGQSADIVTPSMDDEERRRRVAVWKEAVSRSLKWHV